MKTKRNINEKREEHKREKRFLKLQKHEHLAGESGGEREQEAKFARHHLKKEIVKILAKRGPVSIADLVAKLDVQPSQVMRILKKLELKGVVIKRGEKRHGAELREASGRRRHHHHREGKGEGHGHRKEHNHSHGEGRPAETKGHHHHHRKEAGATCRKGHDKHGKGFGKFESLEFALNY